MKQWILLSAMAFSASLSAHGGGLDANGCHTNRKTGVYHCHGAPARGAEAPRALGLTGSAQQQGSTAAVPFRSCAEARAAGAAPLVIGDPGYSARLDRDRDGVACE